MTDPTSPAVVPLKAKIGEALIKAGQALVNNDSNALQAELSAFLDARIHVAIADALAQLTADESTLMLPLTAWANGWMQQVRTDYSPGGALAQTLKDAVKGFKLFLPNPEA